MEPEELIKPLSDPTRYRIIQLLLERHHCSRSLSLTLGITDSAVSQHMSVLRKSGLIESFRHGRHVHYMVNDKAIRTLILEMEEWLSKGTVVKDCREGPPCSFRACTAACRRHKEGCDRRQTISLAEEEKPRIGAQK